MTPELCDKAIQLKAKHGSLSIPFLQRKLQVGCKLAKELMYAVDSVPREIESIHKEAVDGNCYRT